MAAQPAFDWDEAKARANRVKHGLSFQTTTAVWLDPNRYEMVTSRLGDGENRSKMLGIIGDKLYAVIFVRRDGKVRLISGRRTNGSEDRAYDRHLRARSDQPASNDR